MVAFLGKPSSIQQSARNYLTAAVPDAEYELDKERFQHSPEAVIREAFGSIKRSDATLIPVVLLDIGGYFVPGGKPVALHRIEETLREFGYTLVGIVEDTENGHKRYELALAEAAEELAFSVYSVARSPLKSPENHLVGVAVTFSIEALLRRSNIVLQSRRAGVIGFGPIGRSVAHSLRNRGIAVSVCEIDPIRLAQATAQGFRVFHYERDFEDFARGTNLIVSATGAGADTDKGIKPINASMVGYLQNGTFIASVTSHDDELDLESIRRAGYSKSVLPYNEDVSRWSYGDSHPPHEFFLMLDGNAVNFKHEGVVGPAIQLLQGEVLACVAEILNSTQGGSVTGQVGVRELSELGRRRVAEAWLDQYLVDSAMSQ